MISGCPMSGGNTKVPEIIENKDGIIVAEESCTGTRSFWDPVDENDENKDPMLALAERYLKIPCSCMSPNKRRIENILELVREFKVEGVVYYTLQFCHGYNIEKYKIQQALKQAGIPMLAIETDYSDSDIEQIGLRVDAFLEMLCMITAGIDSGSATTKAVLIIDGQIVSYQIIPTGFDFLSAAEAAYKNVLSCAGVE